jgi:hypothetical protein
MFNKLSYKKKNRLLLAGMILSFLTIYHYTFQKTIALYMEAGALSQKNDRASGAPQKIEALQLQAMQLDRLAGSQQQTDSNIQQGLLNLVSAYCQQNNALLKEFPQTFIQKESDYTIEINSFIVEGNFKELAGLVYELEQKNRMGNIASVDYRVKKDPRSGSRALTANVFMQNIKKNSIAGASRHPVTLASQ